MSGAKFTKGDWVAEAPSERHIMECGADITTYEVNCGEKEVCGFVFLESNGYSLGEASANANLIAAAPEMYEMLELIANEAKDFSERTGKPVSWVKDAEALLTKARGETV